MSIWDLYRLGVRVDAEDFHYLQDYTWHIVKPGYVASTISYDKSKILLHRLIMEAGPTELINHINLNGLDCRRSNLERTDRTKNRLHSDRVGTGISRVRSGRYIARFLFKGQRLNLGTYDTFDEAFVAKQLAISQLCSPTPIPASPSTEG